MSGYGVKLFLICGSLIGILVLYYTPYEWINGLESEGELTLAILFFAILLWLTELIPATVTSLIVIVAYPLFNIITFEESASSLGNQMIWLIISMLIMAAAVKKTNLDKRLSFFMLSLSHGKIKWIYLNLILLAFLLTFIIPNAMGRLAVLLPIGLSLIETFKEEMEDNFSKAVILIITFVPYLSTISIMTGAGGSIYAVGLFDSILGYEWSYIKWMVLMTPITLLLLGSFWLLVLVLFPLKKKNLKGIVPYIVEERKKLGAISHQEIKLIILYGILLFLWITKDWNGLPISMTAVLVSIFLFIPGVNVISWKEAKIDVNWGVPFIFAAGFTIAFSLQESGAIIWITSLVEDNLQHISTLFLPFILMSLFIVIRIIFTNFTAMVASLMPVALTFAAGTDFNPVWLGMICVVASSTSYFIPSQSVGSMTTYAIGYYSSRDMFLIGSIITVLTVIFTLGAAFFYWPLLGLERF
ncbi:SLC13 family permease [Halobacillus sp. H74]|uniref:SLC13 family permease n=1 Tax=Halobacillus sp. H74 TaxID=3457436 RepID=UPI003FCCD08E